MNSSDITVNKYRYNFKKGWFSKTRMHHTGPYYNLAVAILESLDRHLIFPTMVYQKNYARYHSVTDATVLDWLKTTDIMNYHHKAWDISFVLENIVSSGYDINEACMKMTKKLYVHTTFHSLLTFTFTHTSM